MRIDVLTLFKEQFTGFFTSSIIKRAIDKGLVEVHLHDFRDYSIDPHHHVDDTPYGGGGGMVLCCQPIVDCLEKIKQEDSIVILLTPDGKVYHQEIAYQLSKEKHLIFICGHYEGFDERIRSFVDLELSIGDYIWTGGEIPSMVVMDSIIRLIDGVITTSSHEKESFNNHLLDYPTYTKPYDFRGMKVPDVLISGDHLKIEEYRLQEQIKRTKERRPDIMEQE